MAKIDKTALRTIANGLLADGLEVKQLTPRGRKEIREAIDILLRLKRNLHAEIARLRAALKEIESQCNKGISHTWIRRVARIALEQKDTE